MTNFKEIWQNGTKRLLLVLVVISALILILAAGVAGGIIVLDSRVRSITKTVETVSGIQAQIASDVSDNTDSITSLSEGVNNSWQSFQQQNPTQAVPQLTEIDPKLDGKAEVIIKPPIAKPKNEPPNIRTRTVIKYKARPTPTPLLRWLNPQRHKNKH